MTDLQRQALILSGADPDRPEDEPLKPSQERLLETVQAGDAYLQKKYPGVRFVMDAYRPVGLLQPYDEFGLHPESADDQQFSLDVLRADDGTYTATDNYYGLLKTEEYETFLSSLLKELDISAGVYSSIICQLPEQFDADMPIEKAASKGDFFSYTWILLPPGDDYETRFSTIQSMIEDKGLGGTFTVYQLLEPLAPDTSKEDVNELIPSHTEDNPVYSQKQSFTVFCES